MYKQSVKFVCLFVFAFLLVAGCGGGGSDPPPPPPNLTLADLVGTYTMVEFTVTYDNGTIFKSSDATTFSGAMVISSNGKMLQTVELNGVVAISESDILSVSNTILRVTSAGCTYDLGINLAGNILTTNFASGTCGTTFSEIDVWKKDATTSQSQSVDVNNQITLDEDDLSIVPGGGMGALYNYLP